MATRFMFSNNREYLFIYDCSFWEADSCSLKHILTAISNTEKVIFFSLRLAWVEPLIIEVPIVILIGAEHYCPWLNRDIEGKTLTPAGIVRGNWWMFVLLYLVRSWSVTWFLSLFDISNKFSGFGLSGLHNWLRPSDQFQLHIILMWNCGINVYKMLIICVILIKP